MVFIARKLVRVPYICQTLGRVPARCRAAEIRMREGPTSLEFCDLRRKACGWWQDRFLTQWSNIYNSPFSFGISFLLTLDTLLGLYLFQEKITLHIIFPIFFSCDLHLFNKNLHDLWQNSSQIPVLKNLVVPLLSHSIKENSHKMERKDQFKKVEKISPLKQTHIRNRRTHKTILIHIHDKDISSLTQ